MSTTYMIGSLIGFAVLMRAAAWFCGHSNEARAFLFLLSVCLLMFAAYTGLLGYVVNEIGAAWHSNSYWSRT